MSTLPLTRWWRHADGTLHRFGRDPVTADRPGIPLSVTVTQAPTATTADLAWAAPASDGGSPVTGYVVTGPGGTFTVGASTFTYHFTGLTAGTSYTFTVAATNAQGNGPVAQVTSRFARFPGDTLPKVTGTAILGLDETDEDPTHIASGERAAPETLAGVPTGGMRAYFSTTSDASSLLATPNGPIMSRIKSHAAKGRMTFWSIHFDNLTLAADGRNNTPIYGAIAYIEESLPNPVPVHATGQHEIDDPNLSSGTVADWGQLMKTFAWQRDKYADAHGGVGVYRFKNFALSFILTASGYARGDGQGAVGPLWRAATYTTGVTASASSDTFTASNHMLTNGCRVRLLSPPPGLSAGTDYYVVQATTGTLKLAASRGGAPVNVTADATGITIIYHDLFDFAAVDAYQFPLSPTEPIGRTGFPMWQANFVKTVAWVEDPAHTYPLAVTETGVHYNDADAGTQLAAYLERVLDGTHDIFAVYYFNSHGAGSRDPAQWALMNVRDDGGGNARLLDVFVGYMLDPRFVHFYDLGYPRPPGV